MSWEIFRFELGYQLRRVSTRIYFGLFLVFAILVAAIFIADARRDGYFFNAPIIIAVVTIVGSMLALLVTAGMAGDAATRDIDVRMHSLLFTTPLRKSAYLGGRFLGAFAVTALLLLAIPLGLLLATRLPGVEPQLLGPFRAEAYLTAYFFLALPNAFVATAVLFSLAALTRRAITAYAGAGLLFFSAFITEGFIAGRLGNWDLAELVDPLGYTPLHALWTSLNPLQKSTARVGIEGMLLSNRLLWLGVALAVLALTHARYRFAISECGGKAAALESGGVATALPKSPREFGAKARLRQLPALMRPFPRGWIIAPLTAVLFVVTAAEVLEVEMGTPGAATTARVAALLGAPEIARLIALMIAVSAGQLIWRERDARMDAIAGTMPVPAWLTFFGKFLSLAFTLVVTQLVFLAAGVTTQAMLGYPRFELALYAKILFGYQLAGYVLFAALAMVLHVLINQKYVANVIAVVVFFGTDIARELGVRHNLLLYGSAPDWWYSEMTGFGPQFQAWAWFTLYWSGWALLGMAIALWRLRYRPTAIAAIAVTIILGAGGFAFYNTNVLHRYFTDAEVEQRQDEYERVYGKYASLAQPVLAATKLYVDFHPSRGTAEIRGSYRLENRSGVPIDAIHLVTNTSVETNDVAFDRPSRVTLRDDDYGYRIYTLGRPVQPGESVRMSFTVAYAPRGFTNAGRNPSVVANGSWIQHRADHPHGERQWLPFVGYRPRREPRNPPKLEDLAARNRQRGREHIDLETIVSTDAGQIGVAPGALRRTWTENGRSYAHYVTDAPVSNSYAIYSANYAIRRARWRNVEIEVFYHPTHTGNLERMVRSAQASLDYHTRHYGPYPHRQLRLVEYPSTGRMGLTSFPGLIEYSEGFALARPDDDPRRIDVPFAVMAHEMGHQWWGHQVNPATVEGAPLLSESLAWYSAMLVVEEALGRDHATRLLDVMRSEYLAPHETRSVPLLRTYDRFDAYRMGPFAMYALREAAGAERVNAALRSLLAKFDPKRPPYPTSLDLYAELRAATPPATHALLKDLFEEITFWDLRAKMADVQPVRGGYRVTLHVEAQKLKANAAGKEKPVPMDDAIEVGVFDAAGKPIHIGRQRTRSGAQTISMVVPRRPARAVVDPDHELLDRKPEDNAVQLKP